MPWNLETFQQRKQWKRTIEYIGKIGDASGAMQASVGCAKIPLGVVFRPIICCPVPYIFDAFVGVAHYDPSAVGHYQMINTVDEMTRRRRGNSEGSDGRTSRGRR